MPPYECPHLSKGYLSGAVPRDRIGLRPLGQYRELGIELELGRRVEDIGLDQRRVLLDDGKTIGWDLLCVAPGSDARRLPRMEGAIYLRELTAAERLKQRIDTGEPLHIAGAGFIGCEVAAVARVRGCDVRLDEALEQPLVRVLGPELGAFIAGVHRAHGVDLRLESTVTRADLVAVGSMPRAVNGLDADGGILVDELGRTSAPNVFAAGDATRFRHPL